MDPFLGNPLKKEFSYKGFLLRFFVMSVACAFAGYYWQGYINDYIDTNHGKVFFIVFAEVFGLIYVSVTVFYELSYIFLRMFVAILMLSYIFFTGVL
ncbi:MAG: hypothetical protein QNK15_00570 [Cycloclasticus sp.]|nr:hypothetical protein [Cycloclasticus sp.]